MWKAEYARHTDNVCQYFSGNPRFLFFDLSKHNGEDLAKFFSLHGFNFNPTLWGQHHVTADKERREQKLRNQMKLRIRTRKSDALNSISNAAYYFRDVAKDKDTALELMKILAKHRPNSRSASRFIQKLASQVQ